MRRLKLTIVAAVFGLEFLFIGLAIAAPYSEAAMTPFLHLKAFGLKMVTFPKYLWDKSPSCPVGDVWEMSASANVVLAHQRLTKQTRLLTSDQDSDKIQTPFGDYWIPRADFGVLIVMLQEEAEDVYRTVNRIGPGSVVLDCGANVGVFTRKALERGAKLVVAIEPATAPLGCLRRNFAAEIAQGRVITYPKGVWDKDAELDLTSNDELASAGRSMAIDRGKKVETIQLTTIDRIVRELNLSRVDFIKLDIEGAEPNALRGAAETIGRFRPKMSVALEHRPTDHVEIPKLVKTLSPSSALTLSSCVNVDDHIVPNVLFVD